MRYHRVQKLISQAIQDFQLDLHGTIVLTEAATGNYLFTPFIAAYAGADTVLAITRNSRYGSAAEIKQTTLALAEEWGVQEHLIVLESRLDPRIAQADIVTNLGFVRPIDEPMIDRFKPTAVLPLMWETWEYRSEDLDLDACRRKGIATLGTNEHHELLKTFHYIGYIALKLLFALEIEIYRTPIIILGSGEFADEVESVLKVAGADVRRIPDTNREPLSAFPDIFEDAEAIVVVEHHDRSLLIGHEGWIDVAELALVNPDIAIAHICGYVELAALTEFGLRCFPTPIAPPGYMSVATDYVGPTPLIRLHSAGLKVGQELLSARRQGLSSFEAECAVLNRTSLAQGFAGYHNE